MKDLKRESARGGTRKTDQRENRSSAQRRTPEHEQRLKSIKRELSRKKKERSRIAEELRAAKRAEDRSERVEQIRTMKSKQREIFLLENELRNVQAGTEDKPRTGALPDFAIIGAPKSGTTFLYHILAKHPHVQPAAFKEPLYFDLLFDKGTGWYRGCFPAPRLIDGRRTITGEATPGYLFHPLVPQRMAQLVPQVRLIAVLRNPVDRTYSEHQFFRVRHGREKGSFEETVASYLDLPPGEKNPLRKSIYVDHLVRWTSFFSEEQMLVLKSEEFFEHPEEVLDRVVGFLGLPRWKPGESDLYAKRNEGSYERVMDRETRRRLEEYFEPHNRRLYDYLGVDFGW